MMTLGMSTAIDPRLSAAFSDIERYRCAMAQLTTLLETYVVAGGGADLKDTYAVSLKYGPPARIGPCMAIDWPGPWPGHAGDRLDSDA